MKIKFLCIFTLLSSVVSADRLSRYEERLSNSDNYFEAEKKIIVKETVNYDVNNRGKKLHLKAIRAFYLKNYQDSEACFSLSLKIWPSSDLLFEFALCSSLYPLPQQSLERATELTLMFVKSLRRPDGRGQIMKAVIAWQRNDLVTAKEALLKMPRRNTYKRIAKKMLANIDNKVSILDDKTLVKLLPNRLSSSEKRSRR